MNSRDAEYEDAVKQLIESTRPDSEKPTHEHSSSSSYDKEGIAKYEEPGVIIEIVSGARKKRKRVLDPEKPTSNNGNSNTDTKPDLPVKRYTHSFLLLIFQWLVNVSCFSKRNRSNSTTPDRVTNPLDVPSTSNAQTMNGLSASSRQSNNTPSSSTKPNAAGSGKSRRGKKEQTNTEADGIH